ncbi:telomere repeat-binding protein 2-like isoform X2 [Phoenix dactylifera]|nr:telomere repeat-binding protein 2-like isoform X2 [Phoenix dactylifera]XP_038973844.1 telomere repeat-binding protein 2-like isoform X2 [Phoenix dactylifera]XP_038973845.1 telomere repeat-binding protein 2-like isoform X2 [Phoenix dactylifera]XP_038973846.1 telomere repeat-binding protein 2-like isoform X2 [Phoenix dactylifera]
MEAGLMLCDCQLVPGSLQIGIYGRLLKLSIKSFKVPELFVEIPQNATVGSLKSQEFFQYLLECLMTILARARSGAEQSLRRLRSVDKTRPSKEQSLVDWARPKLNDNIVEMMMPTLDTYCRLCT